MKRVRRPTLIASSEPFTSQNANASAADMPRYRGISRAGSFRASSAAAERLRWAVGEIAGDDCQRHGLGDGDERQPTGP